MLVLDLTPMPMQWRLLLQAPQPMFLMSNITSPSSVNWLPECFIVQLPYKSVVATPADDRAPGRPELNVEARIDEHASSYTATSPSLTAELILAIIVRLNFLNPAMITWLSTWTRRSHQDCNRQTDHRHPMPKHILIQVPHVPYWHHRASP